MVKLSEFYPKKLKIIKQLSTKKWYKPVTSIDDKKSF